ncbi:MAG: hypothetical protein NTX66_02260 [Candidatus Falkowbacteria bacterium]|nr:hypothetical protein [Candidatus Falkowbacteria bacterium]
MGWRFLSNFLTVLAILGLTIFSLVSFTDKNVNAENNPDNYYFFAQVLDVGKKVVKFLEDPQSIFIKGNELASGTNSNASSTTANTSSDSASVIAYGDFAGQEGEASTPADSNQADSNQSNPDPAQQKNTGAGAGENSATSNSKFDFSKEMKSLEEATNNLKDPNWRQEALPAKISNTFKKYTEDSTNLMADYGFFYNKTATGHALGWQTKGGKVYQINLPWIK